MAKLLTKQAIFGAQDIKTEDVAVPEWGGVVRVRGLTGIERDNYEQSLIDQRGKKTRVDMRNARAKLVAMTVVNETGERLFSDDEITILGTKSAAALDRIYDVAAALSGVADEDIEELLGNSGPTTSGASPSA